MNAFDNIIERIDEINVDKELLPAFKQAMTKMSTYFDNLNELTTNYNDFFEKFLYNNLKIVAVEKTQVDSASGVFIPNENKIEILKEYLGTEFCSHILVHEFIHFIIHNQYPSLPAWADEMMTEFTTIQVTQKEYSTYFSLISIAHFMDSNFEKINIEQFLNGKFNEVIEKYNFNEILPYLEQCTKLSFANQIDMQPIFNYLIDMKLNSIINEGSSLNDYIVKFVDMSLQNIQNDNVESTIRLTQVLEKFVQSKCLINNYNEHFYEIKDLINIIYIQKLCELKTNSKINAIKKFKVDDTENYILFTDNKIYGYMNCNHKFSEFVEFTDNNSYNFSFSLGGSKFGMEPSDKPYIRVNDEKFYFSYKNKQFIIPNAVNYDTLNDKCISLLKNKLTEIIYEDKCHKFNFKNAQRLNLNDASLESELEDINNYIKQTNTQLFCTKPDLFTTSANEDKKLIYIDPVYIVSSKASEESAEIGDFTKDLVENMIDSMALYEQVNIFIKKDDKPLCIANLIKTDDNNSKIAINYSNLIKILPKEDKDRIYSQFVSKQECKKLLEK